MACVSRVAGFGLIYSFFLARWTYRHTVFIPFFWHYTRNPQPSWPTWPNPRDPLSCMVAVHPSCKKKHNRTFFCPHQHFSQIWRTQQYWALQLVSTPSGGVPNPYILNLGTRLLKTLIWLFFRTPRSSKTLSVHLNFRLFYVFFSLLPKCLKAWTLQPQGP